MSGEKERVALTNGPALFSVILSDAMRRILGVCDLPRSPSEIPMPKMRIDMRRRPFVDITADPGFLRNPKRIAQRYEVELLTGPSLKLLLHEVFTEWQEGTEGVQAVPSKPETEGGL